MKMLRLAPRQLPLTRIVSLPEGSIHMGSGKSLVGFAFSRDQNVDLFRLWRGGGIFFLSPPPLFLDLDPEISAPCSRDFLGVRKVRKKIFQHQGEKFNLYVMLLSQKAMP